jgi:sugar/nucleoside kinase (ribokinase family)
MLVPTFDVIVCGSLHLDILVYSPSLPRPDETVQGTHWDQQCGGKGGNQAVMSARAGARTCMIGRIGDDDFGTKLIQNLKAVGVNASAVLVDPTEGSGMSAAIVRNDGDYGAVIVSGANLRIPPDSLHGNGTSSVEHACWSCRMKSPNQSISRPRKSRRRQGLSSSSTQRLPERLPPNSSIRSMC